MGGGQCKKRFSPADDLRNICLQGQYARLYPYPVWTDPTDSSLSAVLSNDKWLDCNNCYGQAKTCEAEDPKDPNNYNVIITSCIDGYELLSYPDAFTN